MDTVRAVELVLGVSIPGLTLDMSIATNNVSEALLEVANASTIFNSEVLAALKDAAPMLLEVAGQLAAPVIMDVSSVSGAQRNALVTT